SIDGWYNSSIDRRACPLGLTTGGGPLLLGGGGPTGGGVYVCVYVDYVGVSTQSIEHDRLIGIGVVLDNSFRSLLSDGEMIIEI
ncbi:hypothetical protein Tco_0028660, partial [Tanacetum coccineum]